MFPCKPAILGGCRNWWKPPKAFWFSEKYVEVSRLSWVIPIPMIPPSLSQRVSWMTPGRGVFLWWVKNDKAWYNDGTLTPINMDTDIDRVIIPYNCGKVYPLTSLELNGSYWNCLELHTSKFESIQRVLATLCCHQAWLENGRPKWAC